MHEPLVSVIIPIYNMEPYLGDCLDSVLAQTLTDWEAICINDGSTDGSPAILEEYANKDPRFSIIHQENRGLSAARNTGLAKARGEYVYFLDSDDWIVPEMLNTALSAMEEDGLELVFFETQRFRQRDGGGRPSDKGLLPAPGRGTQVLSGRDYLCWAVEKGCYESPVWMQLYRRSFLLENQLTFEEGVLYEDILFTLQTLLKARQTRRLGLALHRNRIRSDSIVNKPSDLRNLKDMFTTLMGLYRLTASQQLSPAEDRACAAIMGAVSAMLKQISRQLPPGAFLRLDGQISPEDFVLLQGLMDSREAIRERSLEERIGKAVLALPRAIWRPVYRFLHGRGIL